MNSCREIYAGMTVEEIIAELRAQAAIQGGPDLYTGPALKVRAAELLEAGLKDAAQARPLAFDPTATFLNAALNHEFEFDPESPETRGG
jgi:hypothetical protein